MWPNLRCKLVLKAYNEVVFSVGFLFVYSLSLSLLSRALHIAKTNDATVTTVVTTAQRSIMLSYPDMQASLFM